MHRTLMSEYDNNDNDSDDGDDDGDDGDDVDNGQFNLGTVLPSRLHLPIC